MSPNYTPNNHWFPMSVEAPKEEVLLLHFGGLHIETASLDENNDWRLTSSGEYALDPWHWSDFTPPPPTKEAK
jgi:hypothetical protein